MKGLDLLGARSGILTVIEPDVSVDKKGRRWKCLCDCGNVKYVFAGDFNAGRHTSCGCKKVCPIEIGSSYGKWTVVERVSVAGRLKYRCVCECGNTSLVSSTDLRYERSRGCRSCGTAKRLDYGEAEKRRLIRAYRRGAKKRGLEFDLSEDLMEELFKSACHYCGWELSCSYEGRFDYNGIDRVDNAIGYVKDNVVACCFVCNRAKNSMPYNDFVEWADRLAKYRHKKGE